jgi:hypothetical protein
MCRPLQALALDGSATMSEAKRQVRDHQTKEKTKSVVVYV